MKISDAQPGILQLPNVERGAQAQATGAQVAQQAFAQQMERLAQARPAQVQATRPGAEGEPATISADQRGDRARRRPAGSPRRGGPGGREAATDTPVRDARLDVRI